MTESFAAAGWSTTEPLNAKTFARTYQAFSAMTTYPNAPVSSLYYDGRPAGVVFQKSLNTLAKRHHIRLWPVELAGQEFWLGAATHDIGVGFDWSRMSITHRIDPYLDRERSIIFDDLTKGRLRGVVRPRRAGPGTPRRGPRTDHHGSREPACSGCSAVHRQAGPTVAPPEVPEIARRTGRAPGCAGNPPLHYARQPLLLGLSHGPLGRRPWGVRTEDE